MAGFFSKKEVKDVPKVEVKETPKKAKEAERGHIVRLSEGFVSSQRSIFVLKTTYLKIFKFS